MTTLIRKLCSIQFTKSLATSITVGGLATLAAIKVSLEQASAGDKDDDKFSDKIRSKIPINLMDKIAQKPYLHFAMSNDDRKYGTRPPGVPTSLRILAIDLPQVRQGFAVSDSKDTQEQQSAQQPQRKKQQQNYCRLSASHVYPDGIAAPRKIQLPVRSESTTTKSRNKATETFNVEQKAWVKSMYECFSSDSSQQQAIAGPGVQVMEASTTVLNPYNLRKIRRIGTYNYDPGRHEDEAELQKEDKADKSDRVDMSDEINGTEDVDAVKNDVNDTIDNDNNEPRTFIQSHRTKAESATVLDEIEAPWHQRAWMEEMRLRIQGKVAFGETMQENKSWFSSNFYATTIPSARKWWHVIVSPSHWFGHHVSAADDGVDGCMQHRSCHKPHVVIANGLALQRVPSSLKHIQRACKDANVPLFVVYDPRVWGGNTHDNLDRAWQDIRRTVQDRVITNSLRYSAGTAFARGRQMGQLEANTQHRLHMAWQQTQNTVTRIRERMLWRQQQKEKQRDWSKLSEIKLREKLELCKVIEKVSTSENGTDVQYKYSDGLRNLASDIVAKHGTTTLDQLPISSKNSETEEDEDDDENNNNNSNTVATQT